MDPTFIYFSVNFSISMATLPFLVMLLRIKTLKKRRFGWTFFGYITSLFLVGFTALIAIEIIESPYPIYYIFIPIQSYFIYLVFKNEYSNKLFKRISLYLFLLICLSNIIEFSVEDIIWENNDVTFAISNFVYILMYFMYLFDLIKNNPSSIYDKKGPFMLLSITLFYAISHLIFAIVEEDLRQLMEHHIFALKIWEVFIWTYTFYLVAIAYFLWKNLRMADENEQGNGI